MRIAPAVRYPGGEVTALAFGAVRGRLVVPDELAARVADGKCDPHEAADELLASLGL